MKKTLLFSMLFFSACMCFAGTEKDQLFISPDAEVSVQLSELTALESYLNENPDLQITDLKSSPMALKLNSDISSSARLLPDETALGIPSFIWGCGLGVAGVAVVYFVTEDKVQTKKALYGCLASGVAWTVLYFAVFAASTAGY